MHVYFCIAELSNLLVMRQGVDPCAQSNSLSPNMSQLRFHQIKDKELIQVMRTTSHLHMTPLFYMTRFVFSALQLTVVFLSRSIIWAVGPELTSTQDICKCKAGERMMRMTSSTTTLLTTEGSQ